MNILKEVLKSRSKIDLKLLAKGATTLQADLYNVFKSDIDNTISDNFTAYKAYKKTRENNNELKSIRLWFAAKTCAQELLSV